MRSALDVDGDGSLSVASDRVQETDTRFVASGQWQESVQKVYVAGTPITVSRQRTRLKGLSPSKLSESESIDIYGNKTVSTTQLNASTATITQIVNVPDSDTDAITISIEGRTIASTSPTGLTVAFQYDGLGRRTHVIDPRTGTSTTHYDAAGRVDYVEDALGHRTSFGYDAAGRKSRETNHDGKVNRFDYNLRGELIKTWGNVPYPVAYAYDAYGRRTSMTTFRTDAGFADATFPAAAVGDATTWVYDEATGLLTSKRDAQNRAVSYSYETGGRLKTRTWARGPVTSYAYHPTTGELASVDYGDATPDVAFQYDSLGRTISVVDGTGTKTFSYDPATLRLLSEAATGLVASNLTHQVATTGLLGRATGFSMPGYVTNYGYDTKGRLANLAWNVNAQTDSVAYARTPNSELLAGLTYASGPSSQYQYEPLATSRPR